VLNYAHSPASLVVPSMIGELGVELIGINAFIDAVPGATPPSHEQSMDEMSRLVLAVGADLGVVMDVAAERIWVVDERGTQVDAETMLLLLLRELSVHSDRGSLLVPITETGGVEQVVNGAGGRVERTKSSLHALLSAATEDGVLFAGASGGGYAFPEFLPAYDALVSTGKVLEILARSGKPLSKLTAGLPRSTLIHTEVPCPWAMKGTAMRLLIEAAKDMETDHTDGIKVIEPRGWVQMIPDPDEPVFHIYAEGTTRQDSVRLEAKYRGMLEQIVSAEPAGTLN
jgi:mannose-1-phosphate guanylyltransferase/phosphomannomutase